MHRQVVLHNNTSSPIGLMELQELASDGRYSHETWIDPYSVRLDFPATFYKGRNRDSTRGSEIVIFAGEGEARKSLCPEIFPNFVKLIFELDDDTRHLVVYGIRSRLTDICCLSGFSFLGRDYCGRPKEEILRTGIIRASNKKGLMVNDKDSVSRPISTTSSFHLGCSPSPSSML